MDEYLANTNPYVHTYYNEDELKLTGILLILFIEVSFIICILGDMCCFKPKQKDNKQNV